MNYERIQDSLSNPSPVALIEVSNPSNSTIRVKGIKAIVETGAGITSIPEYIIDNLGRSNYTLKRVRSSLDGKVISRKLYRVVIQIGGKSHEVEVLGIPGDYGVIGRDILNQYKIILDAPNEVWSIE
jgi:predicted aspartyl protease